MEHHISWFTVLLNKIFGGVANALLAALHIKPHDSANPIIEPVAMSVVVVILGMVIVLWLKSRLSVECPGSVQQVFEWFITNPLGAGIRDSLDSNVAHGGRKFIAMVGSVSIFVLLSNLISVIPTFSSPTAHPSGPLACALITFCYFNWQGIRHSGVLGYLKHFCGPSLWIAPLIFTVEIISTCARIMSLTVRLYANIFASELIYVILLGMLVSPTSYFWAKGGVMLIPAVIFGALAATIPLVFIGLHIFVAVVQSYVFTLLPSVYLGMATADEH